MRESLSKRVEQKRTRAIETALPLAMALTIECGGVSALAQTPQTARQEIFQPPPQATNLYQLETPTEQEIQGSPFVKFLLARSEKDLAKVGLKKSDIPHIITGIAQKSEIRILGNGKREHVMYTNTDILDRGFHLWCTAALATSSLFSPADIRSTMPKFLNELEKRTGLKATLESSTASSNVDLYIIEKNSLTQTYTGGHGKLLDQKHATPLGVFADNTTTYADAVLVDHRIYESPHYKNLPKNVAVQFGIDVMQKLAIHEILAHLVLGRKHTRTQGDISKGDIQYQIRSVESGEAKLKPWSYHYQGDNGKSYTANFTDGFVLDDETNKLIRFLRLARSMEKPRSNPPSRTHH